MANITASKLLLSQWTSISRKVVKRKQYISMRDGHRVFVRSIGRGKPVMLLHGFAMNSTHWLPFALPHAHRYRFILPDLRGFGRSHHVPFNRDDILSNYVEDVHDILDHFHIDKIALGGVSMGAYTALQLNRMGGFERVGKYLNIDQCAQVRNGADWQHGLFGQQQEREFIRFQALMDEAEQYQGVGYWNLPPEFRQKMLHNLVDFFCYAFSRRYQHFIARQLAQRFERTLTRGFMPVSNWSAYLQVMRAFVHQDYDMRSSLADIRVPTTLMIGMRSAMYPAHGQLQMRQHIPHANVVPFHRSGHVPLIDEPLKFHREMSRFLAA